MAFIFNPALASQVSGITGMLNAQLNEAGCFIKKDLFSSQSWRSKSVVLGSWGIPLGHHDIVEKWKETS